MDCQSPEGESEKQGMHSKKQCTFASIDASRDSCNTGMVASGKASFKGTKVPWSKPLVSVSAGWKPDFLHEHILYTSPQCSQGRTPYQAAAKF